MEKLTQKQQALVQLDASFAIELELMNNMAGDEGTCMSQMLIMQCVSSSRSLTVSQSADKLNDYAMSGRVKFSSLAARGALNIVNEIVGHLQMKVRPPLIAVEGNAFFEEVVSFLSYFVLMQVAAEDETESHTLHGHQALLKHIADVEEALEVDGFQFPLAQLSDLNIYSLMGDDEQKKAAAWLKASINNMTLIPSVAVVAHTSEKGSAKSQKRQVGEEEVGLRRCEAILRMIAGAAGADIDSSLKSVRCGVQRCLRSWLPAVGLKRRSVCNLSIIVLLRLSHIVWPCWFPALAMRTSPGV